MLAVEQTLQRLQTTEVRQLAIAALKTDQAFQPRDSYLVPFRDQLRVEKRSEEHIGTMTLALKASNGIQLEPLLASEVDGSLYVIDGHHRLKAYERAQRETVPVRVMSMDRKMAIIISKLVNCSGRALEMHHEQRMDAAWQYLASATSRGTRELPEGQSLRTISGLFGIGYGSVQRMMHKLSKVKSKNWPLEALDIGTGFPRWRKVRDADSSWQQELTEMNTEQITQHEAEQLAKRIGALIERSTPEAVRRALQILGVEAQLEAVNQDIQDFIEETEESMDF